MSAQQFLPILQYFAFHILLLLDTFRVQFFLQVCIGKIMYEYMNEIAAETNMLANVRSIGAITAGDLITDVPRYGYQVFRHATA